MNLFYRSVVGVTVLRYVTGVSSVSDDPRDPHENVPVNEAIMTASQEIPR